VSQADLAFALSHPLVSFQRASSTLTVRVVDEEPAAVQPLHDAVILDFDGQDRLQGCDVGAAETFGLGERLERLAPFMVALEDEAEPGQLPPPLELDFSTLAGMAEDAESGEAAEEAEDIEDVEDGGNEAQAHTAAPEQGGDAGQDGASSAAPTFRSGFVALVGPPNVGKSTLLNALLGQKVAIVSPRPQTTRMAIRGILSRPDAQIVFVDTPGIHQPRTRLGNYMVEQARRTIPDSDIVCMVVDITNPPSRLDERIAQMVRRSRAVKFLLLNKVDKRNQYGAANLEAYRALAQWDAELAISGLHGLGLEALVEELVRHLPAERPLYPTDQVTDQSEREMVSELVREQVLRYTQQEVPHGVAVEVEEWEQREGALYIRLSIYVEKESQKGIVIGAGGAMLKQIGSGARKHIEATLEQPVYLDLWVKARPNWRDDPNSLHWLGYKG
jgi:GTP-binding protein Era